MFKNVKLKSLIIVSPILLLLVGHLFGSQNQTHASEPVWVLQETPTQQFLCSEGTFCVNPSAVINPGSAKLSFGISGECEAVYGIDATWPNLPDTIKPNEIQSIPLSISVIQNLPCPAAIAEKADVSVMFGKTVPPETPSNYSSAGLAEVGEFPTLGASKSAQATASWTAPEGESGELLHVRIATNLKNGLGGYVTYIYEYHDSNTKTDPTPKSDDTTSDVCAIGLKESASLFPSLIKIVSARDSGARFADFSGEVTIAPGNDPKDEVPAEMEMVIATGSIIKTEADSTAIISFADMSTFCMKPFTTVIIDTPPDKESKLSLLAGKVWMNVKKMIQDGSMNVTLNQAVAGIKGTVLILEENGTESTLKVVDGEVGFTSKTDGTTAMVNQGEMVRARASGLAVKESFDVIAERTNWQEFIPSIKDESMSKIAKIGLTIAVLACLIGGAWVVKKKRSTT